MYSYSKNEQMTTDVTSIRDGSFDENVKVETLIEMEPTTLLSPIDKPPISYQHQPAPENYKHQPAPENYKHQPAPENYKHQPAPTSYQHQPPPTSYQHQPAPVNSISNHHQPAPMDSGHNDLSATENNLSSLDKNGDKPNHVTSKDDQVSNGIPDNSRGIVFDDDMRKVDFVLAYKKSDSSNELREKRRQFFQDNLSKEGLQLEQDETDDDHVFVKIHAPWTLLCRQAEVLKLKMPLKIQDAFMDEFKPISIYSMWKRYFLQDAEDVDDLRPQSISVNWNFSRKKIDRFNIIDKDTFFSPIQRIEMVWEVLQAARNDASDEKKRGVDTLLEKHIYEAAYPPHDGSHSVPKHLSPSYWCQRQMLQATWASWTNIFRKQPVEYIRRYFGEKIGFYFAFLGFYTKWLTIPAVGGLLSFLYGLLYTGDDAVVDDYCEEKDAPGNYTMCPVCEPEHCEFFILAHEGCMMATWDYRFDNEATLLLALVSVIWATVFIKMWKRREAELAYEWDTYDLEVSDVVIRPEYEEMAPKRRENPITRELEPFVPNSTRLFWLSISTCVTLVMLALVVAALSGLVMLRIWLYRILKLVPNESISHHNVEYTRWLVHGLIFIVVVIFEKIYHTIAFKLTSWECPKTQAQWMSSFLWKVFLFELINDFVPIFYAAWFKGKLVQTPLDLDYKNELCDAGGCLSEVVELIAVLLLARLVVGNTTEVGIPFLQNLFSKCMQEKRAKNASAGATVTMATDSTTNNNNNIGTDSANNNTLNTPTDLANANGSVTKGNPQYHEDFQLNELELDGVAEEYMEMIVQFAFVTLFIPSFPLAALVCFLNNVAEIRVDAINFVIAHRRPLPIRVPGVQIWNEFLDLITKLAILVNAGLIAFTSDLIPRLYFRYSVNEDQSLEGYGIWALSKVRMEDFGEKIHHYMHEHPNATHCYYGDWRDSEPPYKVTETYWHVMLLRVATFATFTVVFFTFHWLFNFLVPDVPPHVKVNIKRRKFVITKAVETEVVYDKWLKKAVVKKIPNGGTTSVTGSVTTVQDGGSGGELKFRLKGFNKIEPAENSIPLSAQQLQPNVVPEDTDNRINERLEQANNNDFNDDNNNKSRKPKGEWVSKF